MIRVVCVLLLAGVVCDSRAAAPPVPAPDGFPVRIVKLGGRTDDPAALGHLRFCRDIGFNAVWVYSSHAGRWSRWKGNEEPFLEPAFLEFSRWCRDNGVRIFVSVNPVAASRGRFVFAEREGERRIRRFMKLLRRRAGVRDFVISFDDQPTRLTELRDVLRYGESAAPAHIDLVRRLERSVRRNETIWFLSSAYAGVLFGDGTGPYSSSLVANLHRLPERVGMVWTGPGVFSREITLEDSIRARERFGGRRLFLYDNYPLAADVYRDGLGLVLGPLRRRDPRLPEQIAVYLACPMRKRGASRLALLTTIDYLMDPRAYDPDVSWRRAMERLAGDDPEALDALRTQGLEWGGWIGERNYRAATEDDVAAAVRALNDPAAMAGWSWVVRRYPDRMKALEGIADTAFRDDLLERMEARLAVARALPLVHEYRARARAARTDVEAIGRSLRRIREDATGRPDAVRRFDLFLRAAGVEGLLETSSGGSAR